MTKKCRHCGEVVETAVSICPKCQNFAFVETPKVELSQEQFQELVKSATDKLRTSSSLVWRLTWRVTLAIFLAIFTILGIPGAIVGWNIWSSMQGFEQTTTTNIQAQFALFSKISSNQIAEAHSSISNDVVAKFGIYEREASNRLASAYASVTNQIADEFQAPKIKQTVETVAKGDAKEILEAEVEPAVTSFKEDALFIRTVARAQSEVLGLEDDEVIAGDSELSLKDSGRILEDSELILQYSELILQYSELILQSLVLILQYSELILEDSELIFKDKDSIFKDAELGLQSWELGEFFQQLSFIPNCPICA